MIHSQTLLLAALAGNAIAMTWPMLRHRWQLHQLRTQMNSAQRLLDRTSTLALGPGYAHEVAA